MNGAQSRSQRLEESACALPADAPGLEVDHPGQDFGERLRAEVGDGMPLDADRASVFGEPRAVARIAAVVADDVLPIEHGPEFCSDGLRAT